MTPPRKEGGISRLSPTLTPKKGKPLVLHILPESSKIKSTRLFSQVLCGSGSQIRTDEYGSQNPMPYRLAMPHYVSRCFIFRRLFLASAFRCLSAMYCFSVLIYFPKSAMFRLYITSMQLLAFHTSILWPLVNALLHFLALEVIKRIFLAFVSIRLKVL